MKSLKTTQNKIKQFFIHIWKNKKSPKVFIPAIVLLILLTSPFLFSKSTAAAGEIQVVEERDFVQEVAVTGKVTPAEKVDLSFEVGGRVGSVSAEVGKVVKKGTVLARLSNAEYQASLQKSQAQYSSEQARLAELERGSRPEEIAIANSDVQEAVENVARAKLDVAEEIKDMYAKADDAIKSKADQVFRYPRSAQPEFNYLVDGNPSLKKSIENQRLLITELFPKWQEIVLALDKGEVTADQIATSRQYAQSVQKILNDITTALTATGGNLNQDASLQQYRADISSARTSVNAALQELNSAASTLNNNQSALARAQEKLGIAKSGNTSEEIAAQRANAQSAAAGVSSASASLGKTLIIAPFDGVVTRVGFKEGESVSSTDSIVTMMSDSAFEIETFVSENDAPKLVSGQPAKVTLDALGDAVEFEAVVSQVDLSETIKDGVVTYKTRLQFLTRDDRIKSGLTANVVIETDKRTNVIKLPQSAIVIVKGKKNVKLAPAEATEWNQVVEKHATLVPVTTGSIDREGDIEILSGVTVGNKVIIKTPNK